MNEIILVIIIGAAIAGFVQGLSGFAFGMVSMSIWAWFIEPYQAAVLAVFGGLCGQLISLIRSKRTFDFKLLWPFLLGGLFGLPVGLVILPQLDMLWFKTLLGAFLVFFSSIMLFAKNLPKIKTRHKLVNAAVGMAGGIMSTTGGLSGVIPSLWCALSSYEKDEQRNIIQNFSLTMLAITMATYIFTGLVTRQTLSLFALILPAILIPSWLGVRCYQKISPTTFRLVILVLLALSGTSMLIASAPKLLGFIT